MEIKPVSGIMLLVLFLGVLTLAFHVEPTLAIGAISINANGSVTPTGVPIAISDNTTYTLTGDIIYPAYDGIVVQRNNIIIDGNGHTLQGNGTGSGLNLTSVKNVTIKNVNIQSFLYGIALDHTSSTSISGNKITNNDYSVQLNSSSGNDMSGNNIASNGYGIWLSSSSGNSVNGNNITANYNYGIGLNSSSNTNTVNTNDITDNGYGIWVGSSSGNSVNGNNVKHNSYGIWLRYSSGNSVSQNNIANNNYGSQLFSSSGNSMNGNNITANTYWGIQLYSSSNNNSVTGNNLANNDYGIEFYLSSNNNSISGNNITANLLYGIYFDHSSSNTIYHNNFINNFSQASIIQSTNAWDYNYPSGGNYWSPLLSVDLKSGPYQNETGSDGIRDTSYVISANNTDHYPLMGPFKTFYAGIWNSVPYNVDVVSNSTVSAFHFNPAEGAFISFNVTGQSGTRGFSRVTIPKQLLWVEPPAIWVVVVEGVAVVPTATEAANYTYLCFTYTQSTKTVTITGTNTVPEFPSTIALLILLALTLLAIILSKRTTHRKPKT